MRNQIIRMMKGPRAARAARERIELYEKPHTREAVARYQTQRFNDVWNKALRDSPFYRGWAEEHSLPERIADVREIVAFPVLTKRDLVESSKDLLDSEARAFYVSGGSTGEPTKFPLGRNEQILRYANRVVTYSWLGLKPGDRYLHLWGHAHLFGQGRKAVIKRQIRRSKDWLVGGIRLNVYNQSNAEIQHWINSIESASPKFIVGYASALASLANGIIDTNRTIKVPDLKWIISTAETLSVAEQELIERAFGVPVAIEYGAIESGIIAYTRAARSSRMQLLWGSLAGNLDKDGNLRLSTLDPRVFPLINYEIGDQIQDPDDTEHLLSFGSIRGRTGDQLSLKMNDGSIGQISVIPLVGALKNIDAVRTVQAAQVGSIAAEIYVTSPKQLDLQAIKKLLLSELKKTTVHADAESLLLRQLTEPVKSIAGKTNLVIPRVPS